MNKDKFIKNAEDLRTNERFSYPGDTETFGTGAALSRKFNFERVAVNYEVLEPGDRSSWPHAHLKEEEFIYILEGSPQIWINGEVYDLKPNDYIGFPGGTGDSHTLINNSNKAVRAIVVGEIKQQPNDDKIFYPKHEKRNQEMRAKGSFWENHPEKIIGQHDGESDLKRKMVKKI